MIADLLIEPTARPVVGHRGASGSAPENTLDAFDLALAQGAEALEFDVRLSADGVPVVIHDPTLDRTTDRGGAIAQLPWAEIAAADAGARFSTGASGFPYRGRGITIPSLGSVLERYPTVPLLIELKVAESQAAVRAELLRTGAASRAIVASFRHQALEAFRTPPLLAGASRRDIIALTLASWLGIPIPNRKIPRCFAVPTRYRDLIDVPTPRFVRAAHKAGRAVHVWTVNDAIDAINHWGRGVNGIITNFPARILEARSNLAIQPQRVPTDNPKYGD